ncbi:hypothetical protein BH24ACT1_BH24ACT1_01630 [soil metagenome]
MVLSGGVGVVAVVVFVTALAFGTEVAEVAPGARLGVVAVEAPDPGGPVGLAVLVPRCQSERVTSVELLDAEGVALWRVASAKGAIDERYVVGEAEPPFPTVTEIELQTPQPPGPLTAVARLAGEPFDATDRVIFDPSVVPTEGVLYQGSVIGNEEFEAQAAVATDCGGPSGDLGLVTWVFIAAALGVVVTYVMLLMRYLEGRRSTR